VYIVTLLCNDRKKEYTSLDKDSVNAFPDKRDAHNNTVTMETELFSVVSAPRLYSEDSWPTAGSSGVDC
jgi:hypothetical protein